MLKTGLRFTAFLLGIFLIVVGMLVSLYRLQPMSSTWLYYLSDRDVGKDVYRMRSDGSNIESMDIIKFTPRGPLAIAPNQYEVAYGFQAYRSHSFVVQSLLDEQDWLTWQFVAISDTSWSLDGAWIVFQASNNGNDDIYRIRPDGRHRQQLTTSFGSDQHPSYSPDGEWIVFASGRDLDWELYRMRADGSQQTRILALPGYEGAPAWSPDGEWIAFMAFRDGQYDLYKMRPDGQNIQQLTTHPANDQYPTWSANSQWIAFQTNRDGNEEIYQIRSDGSDLQRLTDNPQSDTFPVFSPPIQTPWRGWAILLLGMGITVSAIYYRPYQYKTETAP